MKILVVAENDLLLKDSFEKIESVGVQNNRFHQYKFNHIEIDFLICGHTLFETGYFLGKKLAQNRYHLALSMSLCHSLNSEIEPGSIVNIINDKPAYFGEENDAEFKSIYALKQLNPFETPHQRGAFINMTNAYFNVFLPFRKVPAITTTLLKGNKDTLEKKLAQFPLDVETSNGLAIHYACLSERVNFYRISSVSHNLATLKEDTEKATANLNETFIDILNKL